MKSLLAALVACVVSQPRFVTGVGHPCDEEHGTLCPEHGPGTLGTCLKAQALSDKCKGWVEMHDASEAELKGYCGRGCDDGPCGYTNEATYCLTLWMNQDEVSAACKAAFPPPEVKQERVRSEASKKKSAARRAAREAAAERVRRMQAGEDVEAEADSSPRAALPGGGEL